MLSSTCLSMMTVQWISEPILLVPTLLMATSRLVLLVWGGEYTSIFSRPSSSSPFYSYTPPAMRRQGNDDVFVDVSGHARTPSAPRKSDAIQSESWRPGSGSLSSSGSGSGRGETPSPESGRSRNTDHGQHVQQLASENSGSSITGFANTENSQTLYLPSCCVFVAK